MCDSSALPYYVCPREILTKERVGCPLCRAPGHTKCSRSQRSRDREPARGPDNGLLSRETLSRSRTRARVWQWSSVEGNALAIANPCGAWQWSSSGHNASKQDFHKRRNDKDVHVSAMICPENVWGSRKISNGPEQGRTCVSPPSWRAPPPLIVREQSLRVTSPRPRNECTEHPQPKETGMSHPSTPSLSCSDYLALMQLDQ